MPPFPEGLFHELGFRGRVYSPKRALPRLLLGTRDFDEVAVQGEVVPDGVLQAEQRVGLSSGSGNGPRPAHLRTDTRETTADSSLVTVS